MLQCAKIKAIKDVRYERNVFILSCLCGMYLCISELMASSRWQLTMGDFFKDNDGHWWFKTVDKGNKVRTIAVSQEMLRALKHYRSNYLDLPPYPIANEATSLISHIKNLNTSMTDSRTIRRIVQQCFDAIVDKLMQDGFEDANTLGNATVHWLRHTGISDDINKPKRPIAHVRDDVGHSSSAITDLYNDIETHERHASARKKKTIT